MRKLMGRTTCVTLTDEPESVLKNPSRAEDLQPIFSLALRPLSTIPTYRPTDASTTVLPHARTTWAQPRNSRRLQSTRSLLVDLAAIKTMPRVDRPTH